MIPPHNLDAERAVLGHLFLHSNHVDVVSVDVRLTPEDFYRPQYGNVFRALLALSDGGIPIDEVIVQTWLKEHQLDAPDDLVVLASYVPATGAVTPHARIVRDAALRRRVIKEAQEIEALARSGIGDIRDLVQGAEQRLMNLQQFEHDGQLRRLEGEGELDRLTAVAEGTQLPGLPSGYPDIDSLTNGWQPGKLLVVAARPGMGKALAHGTPILTPEGWRPIESLRKGDALIGADGCHDHVLGVYEQGIKPLYRVTFDDGSSVECCDEHQWLTTTRSDRRGRRAPQVRTLAEIRQTLYRADGGANHTIPYMHAAHFGSSYDPLLDPYLLGLYLGDGDSGSASVRFTNPENDLLDAFASLLPDGDAVTMTDRGLRVRRPGTRDGSVMRVSLAALGLLGVGSHERFVPTEYLTAPAGERLALLQGLCDTDGYVTDTHTAIEYSTTSSRLASDVAFLARSLGGRVTARWRDAAYTKDGESYPARRACRMLISFPCGDVAPVRSRKHLAKWKGRVRNMRHRFIVSVEPAGAKPCCCIRVGRELYVAGEGMIVTHNSAFVTNLAQNAAAAGHGVAMFSLEMGRDEILRRLVAGVARIGGKEILRGPLDKIQLQKAAQALKEISQWPLWIDDSPDLSVTDARAKAKRLASVQPVSLVIVDYIQIMRAEQSENRTLEVARMTRGLKILAKELRIPVIAVSQLSRDNEKRRNTKKPQLSDLRDSGAIEQDADMVMFLYREGYYDDDVDPAIAELIVAKHRDGALGTVKLTFLERYPMFASYVDPLHFNGTVAPPPPADTSEDWPF